MTIEYCGKCGDVLFDKKVACLLCNRSFHKRCAKLDDNTIKLIDSNSSIFWKCSSCSDYSIAEIFMKLNQLSSEILDLKKEFIKFTQSDQCISNQIALPQSVGIDTESKKAGCIVRSSSNGDSSVVRVNNIDESAVDKVSAFHRASSVSTVENSSESASVIGGVTTASHANSTVERNIRDKNKNKLKIVGTSSSSDLSAVLKFRFLHVSRLIPETTDSNLKNYISSKTNISIDQLICRRLTKRDADLAGLKFVNFKLGVPEHLVHVLLQADIWPAGVVVRDFINKPKNAAGQDKPITKI